MRLQNWLLHHGGIINCGLERKEQPEASGKVQSREKRKQTGHGQGLGSRRIGERNGNSKRERT